MFTMEQKVDLILRYIATSDKTQRAKLKNAVIEALKSEEPTTPTPVRNIPHTEDLITDVLKYVGMPAHVLGHAYVVYAIQLILKDRSYLEGVTKRLYPDIAVKFGSTASRVERAIRHAVTLVFDRGDYDVIVHVFGNTISCSKGRLTNSEFLASTANYVSRELNKLEAAM